MHPKHGWGGGKLEDEREGGNVNMFKPCIIHDTSTAGNRGHNTGCNEGDYGINTYSKREMWMLIKVEAAHAEASLCAQKCSFFFTYD